MIFVTAFALAAQAIDLRLHPSSKPVVFNTVEDRTEGKEHTILGTRFELSVGPDLATDFTMGPFSSRGRTFGHPKLRRLSLTPQGTLRGDAFGRPPFLLSVPLPGRAVKAGETWTATIAGPTPMAAGVKATFQALGWTTVAGTKCARVGIKLDTEFGGARITGGGEISVRLSDGLDQAGSVDILMVYHRPDQKTRQMIESTRVKIKATIARGA
jgi:hypothetical protein